MYLYIYDCSMFFFQGATWQPYQLILTSGKSKMVSWKVQGHLPMGCWPCRLGPWKQGQGRNIIYIYIYTHTFVLHMHLICVYIYIHKHIHIYLMNLHTYIYTCIFTYTCLYICTYTHTHNYLLPIADARCVDDASSLARDNIRPPWVVPHWIWARQLVEWPVVGGFGQKNPPCWTKPSRFRCSKISDTISP